MTGQKQNPRVHQILKQQVIPFYFHPSRFPPKITTGVAMPKDFQLGQLTTFNIQSAGRQGLGKFAYSSDQ